MSNSNKKPYNPSLSDISAFFVPHKEANHLNAQDVVCTLVKSVAIKGEVVADLIYELQTKLELIEKILPFAFEGDTDNKKAVTL